MLKPVALGLLLALGSTLANAQTASSPSAIHYSANDTVEPETVARVLSQPSAPLTRSIRLIVDAPAATTAAAAHAPAVAVRVAPPMQNTFSLPVQFAFDSATILPAARRQLDAVAGGIKLLPETQKVVLEGHTDARGGEAYNLSLSQRRAATVKEYLVEVHGIDAQRLLDRGLGKQQPIEGLDPFSRENRRVQFRGG